MTKIVVSACLLGCNCRYDGKNCYIREIEELKGKHTIIPVCPEQMGGLSTPRDPSEISGDKVFSNKGKDVTENYLRGAEMALQIAKMNGVEYALFKQKSPSCGKGKIYDGTFSSTVIDGLGMTSRMFIQNGIHVYADTEFEEFKQQIDK